MATANESFQRDPLKFMKSNLVLPPMDSTHCSTKYVTLTLRNDCTCKTKVGAAWGKNLISVYNLEFSTDPTTSFRVYWLPYNNNAQFHMVLSETASYMFTPLMDGCTFSHGGRDPKLPIVAHSNYQTDQHQIDQGKIDAKVDKIYPAGSTYHSLQKTGYTGSKHFAVGSGNVKSTTFGLLKSKVWSFYAQQWESYHKAVARKNALSSMDTNDPEYASAGWVADYEAASKSYELLGVFPI